MAQPLKFVSFCLFFPLTKIELLWRRAIGDMEGRFYCLAHADVLDFSVSKQAVEMLGVVTQGLAGKAGDSEFDLS